MLKILWYPITVLASIGGAAWLMEKLAWFIADNEPPEGFEQFSQLRISVQNYWWQES